MRIFSRGIVCSFFVEKLIGKSELLQRLKLTSAVTSPGEGREVIELSLSEVIH